MINRLLVHESPTDESVGFILGNAGICFPFSSATKRWRSPKGIPADGTEIFMWVYSHIRLSVMTQPVSKNEFHSRGLILWSYS